MGAARLSSSSHRPRNSPGLWFHRIAVLILAVGGLSHSRYPVFAGDSSKKPAKPNVIVILADDLGFADLSISGNREVATPQIDSVAKNGVRCTNGYVSCPVCSPTRAGFLTGRYQQRFGHEFNPALLKNDGQGQGLPVEEPTIADRLHAAGYATSLIGKWHQGEEEQFHPLKRGFDEFFGFPLGWHSFFPSDDPEFGPMYRGRERVEVNSYLTRVLAAEACSTIERNRQRPFFIYLAFNAVHTPMEAPPETLGRFSGIDDVNRRTYLAMLAELDAGVGSVLDKLRTLGLEEQTLVFFLSDNGGPTTKFSPNGARNTPLRGSKGDTWEGGIHVPFFVQWKGKLPAGAVYEQPVISLDVSATALAAAGIAPPEKPALDGVNLLPYLAGTSAAPPHEYLFWRFGQQMAVRSGDWKLVRPSLGKGDYESVATTPLLFNLKDDLGEQHDLLAQQPEKARQLQAAWDAWNEQLPAPRWPATLKGKKFYTGP